MYTAIEVDGLAELDRAFGQVDKELRKRLRTALQSAARPVAGLAHEFALQEISGMRRQQTINWSVFRVGGSNVVYVAPKERGRRGPGGRRPNLADRLVESMDKAAERARPFVERVAGEAVDRSIEAAGL